MRDSVLCEDLLVQDFNINPSLSSPEISLLLVVTHYCIESSVVCLFDPYLHSGESSQITVILITSPHSPPRLPVRIRDS